MKSSYFDIKKPIAHESEEIHVICRLGGPYKLVKNCDQGLEIAARDKKIRTMLITNQIVGFVTVTAWKK